MNAHPPIDNAEQAMSRRRDNLRDILNEMLWGCAIHSNIGRDCIELQDDAGLEYAVRNVVARAKVMRDTMVLLKQAKLPPAETAADE
jgi:hypothetical protein